MKWWGQTNFIRLSSVVYFFLSQFLFVERAKKKMKRETRVWTETNKWCWFVIFICLYLLWSPNLNEFKAKFLFCEIDTSTRSGENEIFPRTTTERKKLKWNHWTARRIKQVLHCQKMTQCHSLCVYCRLRDHISFLLLLFSFQLCYCCCCCFFCWMM